ncbi:MAG: alpha/beta hydrolase [Pelagibacterales bacterium]|nr:alpha/beta hydrolase [Pelagibacterales bacterium]
MKKVILILSLSFLFSCSGTKDEKLQKKFHQNWNDYFEKSFSDSQAIEVFVVTNRKSKNNEFSCNADEFGVNRDQALKYGSCKVNVPKNHTIGEINLAKDSRQSSNEYFKILESKSFKEDELIKNIKESKRTALVFVHGFNVKYQEALLRAAQIAYDLKYQGPIILFTWPAGASEGFFEESMINKTYENNLANARGSVSLFENFLELFRKNNLQINLAVHSMGHQVVLPALKKQGDYDKTLINELILNAPDFDTKEFSKLVKNIKKITNRITLYCSHADKAIIASKNFNNGERLGACVSIDNIDSINVGLIDDSTLGLGHGYYSSRAVLNDVFQVLIGIEAEKRLFIRKSEVNSSEKYFLRK